MLNITATICKKKGKYSVRLGQLYTLQECQYVLYISAQTGSLKNMCFSSQLYGKPLMKTHFLGREQEYVSPLSWTLASCVENNLLIEVIGLRLTKGQGVIKTYLNISRRI